MYVHAAQVVDYTNGSSHPSASYKRPTTLTLSGSAVDMRIYSSVS